MFKTVDGGKLPVRATKFSAGFDVFSSEECIVKSMDTMVIGVGLVIDKTYIPEYLESMYVSEAHMDDRVEHFMSQHYIELHPRSSMRVNGLLAIPGIIDMDYPDEIKIIVHNISSTDIKVSRGSKIGQLLLKQHYGNVFPKIYTEDNIRIGGLGSTDAI